MTTHFFSISTDDYTNDFNGRRITSSGALEGTPKRKEIEKEIRLLFGHRPSGSRNPLDWDVVSRRRNI